MEDFRKKYWIRKDREHLFFYGVIMASIVGGFVTTWWNFSDRIAVKRSIALRKEPKITKLKEAEILRENRLAPGGSKLLEIGRALEDDESSALPAGEQEGNE